MSKDGSKIKGVAAALAAAKKQRTEKSDFETRDAAPSADVATGNSDAVADPVGTAVPVADAGEGVAKSKKSDRPKARKVPAAKSKKEPRPKKEKKPKAPKETKPKKERVKSDGTKSRFGQSGIPSTRPIEKLNDKEKRVLELLNGDGAGARAVMSIAEMADELWAKSKGKKIANSWVRNGLRRLMRAAYVEKQDRGKFRISPTGRKGATAQAA